jgi:hypothetical protein
MPLAHCNVNLVKVEVPVEEQFNSHEYKSKLQKKSQKKLQKKNCPRHQVK